MSAVNAASSLERAMLFMIAALIASATVPPNMRRKLRKPVAMAMSWRATEAWMAMRLVWNVGPAPRPMMTWYPIRWAFGVVGLTVDMRPRPMVHMKKPMRRVHL